MFKRKGNILRDKQTKRTVTWRFRTVLPKAWGPFLESPETFRAHFGWHNSLCNFKTRASRGRKLWSYFYFYSLFNVWKDQLYRISRSEFTNGYSGPKSFRDLRETGPRPQLFKETIALAIYWINPSSPDNPIQFWWSFATEQLSFGF